jgi:hypothetical protein
MTTRKKIFIICVCAFLLGVVVLSIGFVKDVLWDIDHMHIVMNTPQADQLKEYERILQTANLENRPFVRQSIGSFYLEKQDKKRAREQAELAEQEFRQSANLGGQVHALWTQAVVAENDEAAEKCLRKALALVGDKDELPFRNRALFGLRIPDTLPGTRKSELQCMLAAIENRSGRAENAEILYKQAIQNTDDFYRVSACRDYVEFLKQHNRNKEAAELLKTVETSIENVKTKDQYDNGSLAMSALAHGQEFEGNLPEALRLYKKVASITAKDPGVHSDEHIQSLVSIGKCFEKLKNDKEAEETFKLAYKLAKEPETNEDDPKSQPMTRLQNWCIIHASEPLADFYSRKGDFSKAEVLYRESCSEHKSHSGDVPVSMRYFNWTEVDLADCLRAQGKNDEASAIYQRAIDALKTDANIGPTRKSQLFDGYSKVLKALGKTKEAEEFAKKAAEMSSAADKEK